MRIERRPQISKRALDELYARYNRREFAHPDPIEFLYRYEDVRDREVVALVASSLAYGRVKQIVRSVSLVLERMKQPSVFLRRISSDKLRRAFANFRHRFTTGGELSAMLLGAKNAMARYGSLEACFKVGMKREHETVLPALEAFVKRLTQEPEPLRARPARFPLLPSPSDGSACKRLNLFLRWMVRRDAVDPGGWHGVPPSKLLVPIDTHMHRICRGLKLTQRKQADLRTCEEVTACFRKISPDDPVKYDFALSRLGIRRLGMRTWTRSLERVQYK